MSAISILDWATLAISLIAASGATYAALVGGRAQRELADRRAAWEASQADRERTLNQRTNAYTAQIRAATLFEQLVWHAANRRIKIDELPEDRQEDIRVQFRIHAVEHSAVQLLGSPEVVQAADALGRSISKAWFDCSLQNMEVLRTDRQTVMERMRADLSMG